MLVGVEHVAIQLIPNGVLWIDAGSGGRKFAPEQKPAFFAAPPSLNYNSKTVVLNIHTNGQLQTTRWYRELRIIQCPFSQHVLTGNIRPIFVGQTRSVVLKSDHLAFVALLQRPPRFEVFLYQQSQL